MTHSIDLVVTTLMYCTNNTHDYITVRRTFSILAARTCRLIGGIDSAPYSVERSLCLCGLKLCWCIPLLRPSWAARGMW